jgi:hypothetical protein
MSPNGAEEMLNIPAVEEFWDDLLALIDERQVIPIVGSELLEISVAGKSVPLYRVVAERLLIRYGMTSAEHDEKYVSLTDHRVILRRNHELNDAVCALSRAGKKKAQDLYIPVSNTLREVIAEQADSISPALSKLAEIRDFNLFISTTCDDLLQRAINAVRFSGTSGTDLIEYAPNLSSSRLRDIPEHPTNGYTAVFHLFGRASALPQFAIHDEDILEFVCSLLSNSKYIGPCILDAIRSRSLLLVGCNFSDWLCRFFIRVANQSRLSGDRCTKEFLVDTAVTAEGSLTLFLERFSQNTRIFPGTASEFISELNTRWLRLHPREIEGIREHNPLPAVNVWRGHIFISYSSADRPSALIFADSVKNIGGDIVWIDRDDLHAADDWEKSILEAIERCALFIPLISKNTENRNEGFFHREWRRACIRDEIIIGKPFIMPIVIDEEPAGADKFVLIPDCFRTYHFGHAPGGVPSPKLLVDLIEAIRSIRREGAP